MALFIGVDGGGSQTTCVVADESRMLGTGRGEGCNPVRFDDDQLRNSLHTAVRHACSEAQVQPCDVEFACLGVAGTAREDTRARIESLAKEVIGGTIQVVGDMVVAHESVFLGKPGAIVIAGTGSIAYGRNERGETARAGGWGRMISDEGSGHWIGRRAISALMRAVDAGESTALITHVLHEWHVASREELGRICNGTPLPEFARLFPVVLRGADAGDLLSQKILDEAGEELAALAHVVVRRLWLGPRPVTIAMSGGVFQHSERVQRAFTEKMKRERSDAEVRLAECDPVLGALYLARKMRTAATDAVPVYRHHN